MSKLLQLTEMNLVHYIVGDATPICNNDDCAYFGNYEECYTHLHIYCANFDKWHRIQKGETK